MKGADGFVQDYNAQASVEPEMLLIVGQSVTEAGQWQTATRTDGGSHRGTVLDTRQPIRAIGVLEWR